MVNASGQGRKPNLKSDSNALTRSPKAPNGLCKYGKAEWRKVVPYLVERKIITRADLTGLETYCSMIGIVRTCEAQRMENSGIIDIRMFGVMNRAAATAKQLAAEFGLSPVSRAKLGEFVPDDDQEDDNPLDL